VAIRDRRPRRGGGGRSPPCIFMQMGPPMSSASIWIPSLMAPFLHSHSIFSPILPLVGINMRRATARESRPAQVISFGSKAFRCRGSLCCLTLPLSFTLRSKVTSVTLRAGLSSLCWGKWLNGTGSTNCLFSHWVKRSSSCWRDPLFSVDVLQRRRQMIVNGINYLHFRWLTSSEGTQLNAQ